MTHILLFELESISYCELFTVCFLLLPWLPLITHCHRVTGTPMTSSCEHTKWITHENQVLVGANNMTIENVDHINDCLIVCNTKVFRNVSRGGGGDGGGGDGG